MQITIVETEIHEAIRNHILSQVEIKEGMRIEVDLRSTRGENGYTAVINITPEQAPTRQAAPKATVTKGTGTRKAAGGVAKSTPAVSGNTEAAPAQEKTSAPVAPNDAQPVAETVGSAPVAEPVAERDVGVEEGPKTDAPAEVAAQTIDERVEDQPAPEAVEAQAEAAQAGERRSLFGNLNRPNNSAPAE